MAISFFFSSSTFPISMRFSLIAAALLTAASVTVARAQEGKRPDFPKLDKSPLDATWLPRDSPFREKPTDPSPVARVLYSRPQKNGRKLFGPDTTYVVPFGKVWRTGANESVELKAFKPMTIGGKKLAAGSYAIYTIPGEKEWTVIISSDTDRWGAYAYDQKKDIVRIKAPVMTSPEAVEAFAIVFREDAAGKATMRLVWDTTEVDVPVTY
jgi:Protein of unknown function (DUF2911)